MVRRAPAADEKPLHWVGASKRDFLEFPTAGKEDVGNALGIARVGGPRRPRNRGRASARACWKSWSHTTGTRTALCTRSGSRKPCNVLHAFQKKSPSGRTATRDVDLVAERLKTAERDYEDYGKPKR